MGRIGAFACPASAVVDGTCDSGHYFEQYKDGYYQWALLGIKRMGLDVKWLQWICFYQRSQQLLLFSWALVCMAEIS